MKEFEKRFWFKTEGSLALQSNSLNPNKLLMMPSPGGGGRTSFAGQLNSFQLQNDDVSIPHVPTPLSRKLALPI